MGALTLSDAENETVMKVGLWCINANDAAYAFCENASACQD